MASWDSGYVSEVTYTHGYYKELNPNQMRFAAVANGMRFPSGRLTYCELGCGHGVSTNLLAACNPEVDFYATDFNPTQISGAKALAEAAKTPNVSFYDTAFEDFADEPSLPEKFDVIALHGIYSWINDAGRAAILDFVRRKLAVGGMVYLSYNAYPGWATAEAMRQLLFDHVENNTGPILKRLEEALKFAEDFTDKSVFFAANPQIKERLLKLKDQSPNYLAHEYLNQEFHPFYFRQIAQALSGVKLSFVGSANVMEHIPAIDLNDAQQNQLAAEADPIRRQSLRDYMVNQQFRKDLFGKGMQPHSPISQRDAMLDMRFALSQAAKDVSLKVKGVRGEAELQPEVYTPVLEAFSAGPATLKDLTNTHKGLVDLGWPRLKEAIIALVGIEVLQPCPPAKGETARVKSAQAFNAAVMNMAKENGELLYLASPVTGGAVRVSRFHLIFLLSLSQGGKTPEDWARTTWEVISAQGQKLVKEGKTLDTDQENLTELIDQAKEFQTKGLPMLKTLRVI